jgi:hypothetical protein
MGRRPQRRAGVDGTELERSFQGRVVGLLRVYGWGIETDPVAGTRFGIYHAQHGGARGRAARGDGVVESVGFPDLVAVHPDGVLLFAELKRETGELGRGQAAWLEALQAFADRVDRLTVAALGPDHIDEETARRHGLPRVIVDEWRPSDWDRLHELVRLGRPRRRDLDPPELWTTGGLVNTAETAD